MNSSSRNKAIVWHLLVAGVITHISYRFSSDIVFLDVEVLISMLQNTSAMIFTIMGIWIAYVYPNAVLRVVQPSKVVAVFAEEDIKRVRMLVGVVILSASILALLVIGVACKAFIVKTSSFAENTAFYTSLGLWGLLALTYAQLFCIYAVITSSVNFIFDLKNLEAKKKLSEKLDGKKSTNSQ